MGMQWASDCSTTTDTLLAVAMYAHRNLSILKNEREGEALAPQSMNNKYLDYSGRFIRHQISSRDC